MRGHDLADFGLTAADLRAAADRLYAPGDQRLDPIDWTHDVQVRYGVIRSRMRSMADALDEDIMRTIENLRHALKEAGAEMDRRYEMGAAAERERLRQLVLGWQCPCGEEDCDAFDARRALAELIAGDSQ